MENIYTCVWYPLQTVSVSHPDRKRGWVGRVKGVGRGGGVTTETLCAMDLLHTHPQAAAFAKDQAAK